jgi:hypothetical protein
MGSSCADFDQNLTIIGLGFSLSSHLRTSGEPQLEWTIAFI